MICNSPNGFTINCNLTLHHLKSHTCTENSSSALQNNVDILYAHTYTYILNELQKQGEEKGGGVMLSGSRRTRSACCLGNRITAGGAFSLRPRSGTSQEGWNWGRLIKRAIHHYNIMNIKIKREPLIWRNRWGNYNQSHTHTHSREEVGVCVASSALRHGPADFSHLPHKHTSAVGQKHC